MSQPPLPPRLAAGFSWCCPGSGRVPRFSSAARGAAHLCRTPCPCRGEPAAHPRRLCLGLCGRARRDALLLILTFSLRGAAALWGGSGQICSWLMESYVLREL